MAEEKQLASLSDIHDIKFRVSSVLNKDVKQFGKKYIFDNRDDTCWNSDQGSPQWVLIEFPIPVDICEIHIQFQGGFTGRDCWVEGKLNQEDKFTKLQNIYPEDNNFCQRFEMALPSLKYLKLIFNNSTDFFGRIIIYKVNLLGR